MALVLHNTASGKPLVAAHCKSASNLIPTELNFPLSQTSVRDLRAEHVDLLDLWWFGKQLDALAISAAAIGPAKCALRPASSAKASKMPNVAGPNRSANQIGVVVS